MKDAKHIFFAACMLLASGQATNGQEHFFDDFRDGNLNDGMPIEWHSRWGGSIAPEARRLRLSGNGTHLAMADSLDSRLGWSMQTRASMEGPGLYVGLGMLFDEGENVWLGFRPSGNLSIGTPGVTLAEASTEAFSEDVMLRLDAFDNMLKAWAWAPQDEMPEEPLVVAETEIRSGLPGLWVEADRGETFARFSFFEAATNPLPELVYGDFNFDRLVDASDIDVMSTAIHAGQFDLDLDLTRDGVLDGRDRDSWVFWAMRTRFGDGNLDGQFNRLDLVEVLQAGEYMDSIAGNSTWATGDWNGDGEFDRLDLITALQDGGYEQGPRWFALRSPTPAVTQAVPEPSAGGMLLFGLLGVVCTRLLQLSRRMLTLATEPKSTICGR